MTVAPPSLQYLMTIGVEVLDPLSSGPAAGGEARLIQFTKGWFEGPELRGTVLPGGTDWQIARADGMVELHAHYLIETDKGERVEVVSQGLRHAPPGVLERIAAGETIPANGYYFRTSVRFNTGAPRLDHLNHCLGISTGRRSRFGAELDYFLVR